MHPKTALFPWPIGGGETGALIRQRDWSNTPLGPIDRWPQSLRTMVDIALNSLYPMVFIWGAERIMLYNDAYRPLLGKKHPHALGQPIRVAWSEVWESVSGMFDTLSALSAEHAATMVTQACDRAMVALAANRADIPFALLYLLDEAGTAAHLAGSVGYDGMDASAVQVISPPQIDLSETASAMSTGWPLAQAMQQDQPIAVNDLATRFGGATLPEGPWPTPPHTACVLPLAAPTSSLPLGFLVLGVSSHLPFDDAYQEFYQLAAGQIAAAITNAQAHEAERMRVAALAALDRAKTTFFSNVSHEFRTPLTLILGPLEAALNEDLPTSLREELVVVHRNAQRMLKLVNTLLDFSRIEAGRLQASYAPVDLAALTTDLASVFRSAIERAGLALRVECPPLGQPVYVDREMWEKIVLNLLSNAFKFTFSGEILVALRAHGESVDLTVRDTGTGIPAEEMPHLFERFHRVEHVQARTHEGSGIGLALVQELVRLHGGTIAITSAVDQGTTVTITLPLGSAHLPPERIMAAHEQAAPATGAPMFVDEALSWLPEELLSADAEETPRATDAPTEHKTEHKTDLPRILLVEDNADLRAYLRRLLGATYQVDAVGDGLAALTAARANRPDLALVDIMMPRMDGLELLQAWRADPDLRAIPLILLSARAGEDAAVDGLEQGADDYLIKPFTSREVLARIRAHLQLAQQRRQIVQQLQGLAYRLLEVQEAERRHVARELHDEIGQALTGIQLHLSIIKRVEKDQQSQALADAETLTRDLTMRVSALSVELRPSVLDNFGIVPAVQWYLERYQQRTGIPVTLRHDGMEQRFATDLEVTVYRLVQEALTNVARHAQAQQVTLMVVADAEAVVLTLTDDGRGFDPATSQGGGGLSGMRERVRLLGGTVAIVSAPGQGTTITATIPIRDDEWNGHP